MIKTFDLLASNIENLELKLNGKLPIDRDELLALVNSWGRNSSFYTYDKDNYEIKIEKSKANKKYDLSNLDVSEISNFDSIFKYSNFNKDINSWDISNATSLAYMFCRAENFNQPLNSWDVSNVLYIYGMFFKSENFNQPLDKWDVSKVEDMNCMFFGTKKFNQNLNSWNPSNVFYARNIFEDAKSFNQAIFWDLSNVDDCSGLFLNAKAFEDRFNNGKFLPFDTNDIKLWLKENQNKMKAIEIEENKGKELDNFLLNINVITSTNLNGLHDVIDFENLNELHNNNDIIIN